jgi:hypothetical protein
MCSLKELTGHAVMRAGGPIPASKLLGVSPQEISLWCIEGNNRFIPLDHWVDLDAASGNLFLKELAHKSGFDLTARKVKPASTESVFHVIGKFSKAAGVFACTVLEAAVDGIFSPNEKRKILHAARPLKDCLDDVDHVTAR